MLESLRSTKIQQGMHSFSQDLWSQVVTKCALVFPKLCLGIPERMEKEMENESRISAACVIAALLLSATDTPAATITVTNGNDSGPGSLRQAIVNASSGDTINFAPSIRTVNLTSGQLVIDKNLTVTGPGANRLTVQRSTGGPDFRIFNITSNSVTASISGLTVSNGSVRDDDGDGGGIRNAGVLTLTDCTISGNRAEAYGYTPHFVFGGSGGGCSIGAQ